MAVPAVSEEIDRIARTAYGRLLGRLAARTGNLSVAEDALGDALTRALEVWPERGMPDHPEAWLLTAARNRVTDHVRRQTTATAGEIDLQLRLAERDAAVETATAWPLPDPRLRLLFACAHPHVPEPVRAPMMLQVVLGLPVHRIAPLFLVSPTALGQQLSRTKAALSKRGAVFTSPEAEEMAVRLPAVLEAIYGAFCAGLDSRNNELTHEACFLSELCYLSVRSQPEAAGFFSLCLYRLARFGADRSVNGSFVPLEAQDPASWDASLIARAEAVLRRASKSRQPGRYQLEAAIQSAHIHMCRTGEDKWASVIGLYTALMDVHPTVGAAVARAGAFVNAGRAGEALAALDAIKPLAHEHQPFWATRAAALAATGDANKARDAYDRAIALSSDEATRRFLHEARECL